MRPGDLRYKSLFYAPGCEWRGELEGKKIYMFVAEGDESYQGWFLGPEGLELVQYVVMMEEVR